MFNECVILFSTYWLYLFIGLVPDPEIAHVASKTLTYLLYGVMSANFIGALAFAYFDIKYTRRLEKIKEQKIKDKQLQEIDEFRIHHYPEDERAEIMQQAHVQVSDYLNQLKI